MEEKAVIEKFLEITAEYCDVSAAQIRPEMRFMEDLSFSSFDFMSFLGELEDAFDVEVEEEGAMEIRTVGEAIDYLKTLL